MKYTTQFVMATVLAGALLSCLSAADFPAIPAPEAGEMLPQNAAIKIAGGDILVSGKPRFLIGTIFLEGVDQDAGIKTTGYPESLAWLYESLPDYADAQKLGLDSFGITPEHSWRRIFRPRPVPRRNMNVLRRPLNSGLPILAELAIEKGSHAWMAYMDGVNPKEEAWFEGESSGIPYSVVTEEGRALWNTIWRVSAEYFQQQQSKPFAYRIFDHADFFETSQRAKTEFAKHLSLRYKNVEAMNQALHSKYPSTHQASRFNTSTDDPHIHVAFTKFLEDAFAETFSNALATVASVSGDPEPVVFFQPRTLHGQGIDLYKAAQHQRMLCAPAQQESPLLTALYMQAVAEGKPVVICDIPLQGTADDVRNTLLAQFARGYSMAFVSKWKRDARAWIVYKRETPSDGGRPKTVLDSIATEAAGKSQAMQHPDYLLNPYAVSASAFGGIRQAKQDVLATGDLFSSSNRMAHTHVALLYSRASDRLAATTNAIKSTNTVEFCAEALAFSGIKADIVLEEQLEKIIESPYRVLLASDSLYAVYETTPSILQKFVEAGGTLILTEKAVTKNEYGDANAEVFFEPPSSTNDWAKVQLDGLNATYKTYGSGKVIRLDCIPDPRTLADSLDKLIADAGVRKLWQCLDSATGNPISGIEVTHAMRLDGTHGLILFNRIGTDLDVRVKIDGIETPQAFDLIRKISLPVKDGGFELRLKLGHGEIVSVK